MYNNLQAIEAVKKKIMSEKLNEVLGQMEPKCRNLRQYLPLIHSQKSRENCKFGDPVVPRTSSCMTSIRRPPQHPLDPPIMWYGGEMHSQFAIMSEGTVAPQLHTMFQRD